MLYATFVEFAKIRGFNIVNDEEKRSVDSYVNGETIGNYDYVF